MTNYIHDIIEKVAEVLTSAERKELPDDIFGLPEKRKFPMPDEEHTRMAWKFLNKSKITEVEREQARKRILARANQLGVDTTNWKTASDFLHSLDKHT
jgi:hypothetical protein